MKHLPFLKFVYRGLLTGMPMLTYNPINKNNLHSPFTVKPYSTYINYKLNKQEYNFINNNLSDRFKMKKVEIDSFTEKNYYLSINVYNCSLPVVPTNNEISRCEINTYVEDILEGEGTVILDYTSNTLSMDPVNIFKKKEDLKFKNVNDSIKSYCNTKTIKLDLEYCYSFDDDDFQISEDLIYYSDKIFYPNSIYDKLFYDSSLTRAELKVPKIKNLEFEFNGLKLENPESIFYFKNDVKFAGSIWDNLYRITDTKIYDWEDIPSDSKF